MAEAGSWLEAVCVQQMRAFGEEHLRWDSSLPVALWGLVVASEVGHERDVATRWAASLVAEAASQMDAFVLAVDAPPLQVVAARHQKGKVRARRWSFLTKAEINRMKRPRFCAAEQGEKQRVNVNADLNVLQGNALYLEKVRVMLEPARCFELCMDSSRFGGRNLELVLVYSPDVDLAGYLTPLLQRELLWRTGLPGEPLTDKDQAAFEKSGFKSRKGMLTFDLVRGINHVLVKDTGRDLASFLLPDMCVAERGASRVWDGGSACWLLVPPKCDPAVAGVPELPKEVRDSAGEWVGLVAGVSCLTQAI